MSSDHYMCHVAGFLVLTSYQHFEQIAVNHSSIDVDESYIKVGKQDLSGITILTTVHFLWFNWQNLASLISWGKRQNYLCGEIIKTTHEN